LGYPGARGSHIGISPAWEQGFSRFRSGTGDNSRVDPTILVIIIVIGMPLGVLAGLAYAAKLRGPPARPESRRPVGTLVTDAIPEEHPEDEEGADQGPEFSIDSEPPDPDAGLRGPQSGL